MQAPLKVLFHDERGVKSRGDVTSIPKNPNGSRPVGEIRGGGCNREGVGKYYEKDFREELERESWLR